MRDILNSEKGFTLLEIMIVVAVFGVLASLAVPSYISYLQRARLGEAVTIIQAIEIAALNLKYQKGYFISEAGGNLANPQAIDAFYKDQNIKISDDAHYFSYSCRSNNDSHLEIMATTNTPFLPTGTIVYDASLNKSGSRWTASNPKLTKLLPKS